MGRNFTVHELVNKKFKSAGFEKDITDIIGDAPVNFRLFVWGSSGNGKSTFCAMLMKMLCDHGKFYHNTTEEGFSKSLQKLAMRTNLMDVKKGNLVFGDRDNFSEMMGKLKRNRAKFAGLDSIQDLGFTKDQFDEMRFTYKNKGLMYVSWAEGKEPAGSHAKAIRYLCDIKIYVRRGVAYIDSRYGYTEPFKIPGVYEKFHKNKKIQEKLENPEPDLFSQPQ